MGESESGAERAVAHAMRQPRNILVTILVGNLVVNLLIHKVVTTTLTAKQKLLVEPVLMLIQLQNILLRVLSSMSRLTYLKSYKA